MLALLEQPPQRGQIRLIGPQLQRIDSLRPAVAHQMRAPFARDGREAAAYLGAAGIEPTQLSATQRSEDSWLQLVEIAGHMTNDDVRLARLMEGRQTVLRAVVLGGYPVPLSPDELSE